MTLNTEVSRSRVALLQGQVDDLTKKIRDDVTQALVPFRDAQRELQDQQSLLDALNVRLQQLIADAPMQESPGAHHLPSRTARNSHQAEQESELCGQRLCRPFSRRWCRLSDRISRYQRQDHGRCGNASWIAGADGNSE